MPEGPFPAAHLLYNFTGSLPSGEIWSIGLRTAAATVDLVNLDTYAFSAYEAFATYWAATSSIRSMNPPSVKHLKTTVRQIVPAGTTLYQAEYSEPTPLVGAASTMGAPNQAALVVTTMSNRSGRTGRGRFYLPCLSPSLDSDTGRLSPGFIAGLSFASGAFIHSMNQLATTAGGGTGGDDTSSGPFRIAIESRATGGGINVITSVKVGDVVDTQRRRRDKEVENYSTTPISI